MPIGIDIWHWRKYAPSINLVRVPPKRKLKHVSHVSGKQYFSNVDYSREVCHEVIDFRFVMPEQWTGKARLWYDTNETPTRILMIFVL